MSAVLLEPREARLEPISIERIPAVCAIEQTAYSHPWTPANFTDSLAAGYHCQCLIGPSGPEAELMLPPAEGVRAFWRRAVRQSPAETLIGYFVAMKGVDEVHLLNITVAPAFQKQGWAPLMLEALSGWSRSQNAQWLWLEVRASNHRALAIYEKQGFRHVGIRKGYYPAPGNGREDAVVIEPQAQRVEQCLGHAQMTAGALNLDARQRAMLEEMGIKVWWPTAVRVDEAQAPVAVQAAAPTLPRAAPVPAPMPVAVVVPIPVTALGATVLADGPQRIDAGVAPGGGGWLIVADMPPELDGRHGEAFAGDAGRLLDQMLRSLQLQVGAVPVHLMRTHRGVASGQPESPRPITEAVAEAAAALSPGIVFAMGPLAAQSLLQSNEPLGRLRGAEPRASLLPGMEAVPVVASYHPAYLLRNPADKARAWCDLCLAAEQLSLAR